MFEFFFKYPITVFTKGRLVLLGAWPGWVLLLLIVASVAGLGWLMSRGWGPDFGLTFEAVQSGWCI